ncbi:HNH endonuclease [bacterium]|nr:MAG: HNH endonuclease [bacterium]
MPLAPRRPCTWPGCNELTYYSRCPQHQKQERKEIDKRRGTAAQRGYDSKWKVARDWYLANHPLCVKCKAIGAVRVATVVDHIVPHKGDMELFWDRDNWQALCKACHDSKTAKEDGRWR